MFLILLIYVARIHASLLHYDRAITRSHCSILVQVWKQMGGYSPLDPDTVKDNECCSYHHSSIPGIVCSQMNFVVEIV